MAGDASEPTLNRRDRRRLELTQRILDAGEALFEERGYDETKVAEICERADVAYGTFFNHFPAKADLLSALADRAVRRLSERLEALAKQRAPIADGLQLLFEGGAAELEALSPRGRDLLARVHAIAFMDAPEERDRRFHGAFEAFLRAAARDGRVRDDLPVATLADVVSGTYASMSLSWLHLGDARSGASLRERAAAAAGFLAAALAPGAAATQARSA